MNKKIGFIGQGWIGKNYADNFEQRGYEVVRYALEEPYVQNKDQIKDCDIVFIAVPTPTTENGFSYDILKEAIKSVGKGKVAIIKSTILPFVARELQNENPDIFVMHSPEFLTEATAEYDAANPTRNILGIVNDTAETRQKASEVMAVLPYAPYSVICSAEEAALIKYGGNCWFYFKVLFINMLYDLVKADPYSDWSVVRDAMSADPRIGRTHLDPLHKSGRGAGGHCFIKDFEAFRKYYFDNVKNDVNGSKLLHAAVAKNVELLAKSNKDLDLLRGVYGNTINKLTMDKPKIELVPADESTETLAPIKQEELSEKPVQTDLTPEVKSEDLSPAFKDFIKMLDTVQKAGQSGKYLLCLTIHDPENKTGMTEGNKDLHHFTFKCDFPDDDLYGCLDIYAKQLKLGSNENGNGEV